MARSMPPQPGAAGRKFTTGGPHFPYWQVDVGPQRTPHVPQLSSSVRGSTQLPLQMHGVPSWHAHTPMRLYAPTTHEPSARVACVLHIVIGGAPAAPVTP